MINKFVPYYYVYIYYKQIYIYIVVSTRLLNIKTVIVKYLYICEVYIAYCFHMKQPFRL